MSSSTNRTNKRRATATQTKTRKVKRVEQTADRVVGVIAEEDKEGLGVAEEAQEEAELQLIENATSSKVTTKRKTLPIQLLWLNLAEPSSVRKIWLSMITTTRRLVAPLLPKSESFEKYLRNLCVQREG